MYDPIPSQVPANRDNDLLFRQSGMSEAEKKKREKERLMQESGPNQAPPPVEYFTD